MPIKNIKSSKYSLRFITAAAWSFAGTFLSQLIQITAMTVAARMLGKESYGQFILLQSTINSIGIFSGIGIGTGAIHYISTHQNDNPAKLGRILGLMLIFCILLSLGLIALTSINSEYISKHLLNSGQLGTLLETTVIAVIFIILDNYFKSILIGLQAMRSYAFSVVFGSLLGSIIFLSLGSYNGLTGFVYGFVFNYVAQSAISLIISRQECTSKKIKITFLHTHSEWPVLRDFALPAILGGALIQPVHWYCQSLLAHTVGGFGEIAVVGVAMQWFNLVQFIPSVAGRVVLPLLSESLSKNSRNDAGKLLKFAILSNIFISLPIVLIAAGFSPWILSLYGPAYKTQSITLIVALIASMLLAAQTPVGNLVAATSRMWMGLFMNAGWAVAYILFAHLFLGKGALGIMMAMTLAYTAHAIWTYLFAFTQIKEMK